MWLRDPQKARVRSNPRGGSLIYSTVAESESAISQVIGVSFCTTPPTSRGDPPAGRLSAPEVEPNRTFSGPSLARQTRPCNTDAAHFLCRPITAVAATCAAARAAATPCCSISRSPWPSRW